ncbi:MAG: hypothetical protein AAGJ87_12785, partial [Pseudomonadota bacterium]
MNGSLFFDPVVPYWLAALFVILAVGLCIVRGLTTPLAGAARLLAAAAFAGLLFNPQIRLQERTPLDDIAIIAVDKSASQSLDGRDAVADAAADILRGRLENLGLDVRVTEIDGEEETRLVAGLAAAIADTPRARLAGVFAITDGQATDADDAVSALRGAPDAPIHVLTTGRDSEADRKITLVNAPRYGIVRESVGVTFRVDDVGPDNRPLTDQGEAIVILRVDGEDAFRQPVPIGVEVSFEAPLNRPGDLVIELEAQERPGELTIRNNVAVLPIAAIRDRLRVLLISGEPHAGERVWRNFLKSDPAIDLVHFTILRPLDKNDGALQNELALIEFPQDELFIEKLSEFDLLIFDRYTYRGVMNAFHFDNIARYVETGGAVLIASGPEYIGALSLAPRGGATTEKRGGG